MDGKGGSKEEPKSEASAGEIPKKCGQRCNDGVYMPPSRIIAEYSIDDTIPHAHVFCRQDQMSAIAGFTATYRGNEISMNTVYTCI